MHDDNTSTNSQFVVTHNSMMTIPLRGLSMFVEGSSILVVCTHAQEVSHVGTFTPLALGPELMSS